MNMESTLKRFGIISAVLFKNKELYVVQENPHTDKTFTIEEYIRTVLGEDIIVKDVRSLSKYREEDITFVF